MIKYLIAFLLFTCPCLAGMGIGGFPYPGPGVLPITYTLTIDGTGWNGTDLISVGGSTYTADGTKTGLSGTTSITVTPDTGREATCSGTGITGSSSPYSADMSADRTIACTFSDLVSLYSDDFNRSDGALGSNWDTAGSWPMPQITNNQVKGASASNQLTRFIGASFTSNHKSSITVTSTSDSVAPCVRVQNGTNSGYCAKLINNPSYFSIIKIENGVESSIGLVWDTLSNGDTLGIKASGNTITAIKNGVDYTAEAVTDTTYSSGGAGIWCWGSTPTGDNFSAANL